MSARQDLMQSWIRPRQVVRRILARGVREDRALVYLMVACLLIFIGQWPPLARQATLDPSVPLQARLGGALLAWLFIAPLIFYGIGAVSHLLAKLFGGRGSWYSARVALFWALFCVAPVFLVQGLVSGFLGGGIALTAVGAVIVGGFGGIWLAGLREAEFPARPLDGSE